MTIDDKVKLIKLGKLEYFDFYVVIHFYYVGTFKRPLWSRCSLCRSDHNYIIYTFISGLYDRS